MESWKTGSYAVKPKRIDVTSTNAYKELYTEKLRLYGHVYVKEIDKLTHEDYEPMRRKHLKNNIKSHTEALDENGNSHLRRKLSAISLTSATSGDSLSRKTSLDSTGSDLPLFHSEEDLLSVSSRRSSCFSYHSSCGEEEENGASENTDPNAAKPMNEKQRVQCRRFAEAQLKRNERFARLKSLDGCISKADKVIKQIRKATASKSE